MNSDGISYLDMADRLLQGDFQVLVHPYWSPLYPGLLAIALRVFSPSPSGEMLVAHLVNCFIGLSALASFTFFVSQWSRLRGIDWNDETAMTTFRLHTGLAYVLFLWATGEMIGLDIVAPDLCVAALVYLTAGLCCRLASPRGGWGTGVSLGIVLSLGYFSKAAMLPLAVALLAILAVPRLFVPPRRMSLAVAALIFAVATGPYVFLLSRQQHRLTFGDSGRLNYAWVVLREIPLHAGWIGHTSGTGNPVHPPRVLMAGPTVLEFKHTVPGTYPLWYNPAYFHEGLQVRFDVRKQAMGLMRSAKQLLYAHGRSLSPLLAGIAVLCAFACRRRLRVDLSRSWLMLWPLAAFSMFSLVTIEARYIAPFVVLFWIAVYDAFSPGMLAAVPAAHHAVLGVVAVCILLPQLFYLASSITGPSDAPEVPIQVAVARELARLGLRPGDEIATVGYSFSGYFARLAQLRVIASIVFGAEGEGEPNDARQFWGLGDSKVNALTTELRRIGARAIVIPDKCNGTANNGWRFAGAAGYCVQLLE